uniref:Uncharacterized protein n=1 Tax=Oryzias melastigma TaxID=30732 RepID=A0A3B3CIG2_ORYME
MLPPLPLPSSEHFGPIQTGTESSAAPEGGPRMFWRDRGWLLWATFLGFFASAHSIRRDEFFPFGESAGDQLLDCNEFAAKIKVGQAETVKGSSCFLIANDQVECLISDQHQWFCCHRRANERVDVSR